MLRHKIKYPNRLYLNSIGDNPHMCNDKLWNKKEPWLETNFNGNCISLCILKIRDSSRDIAKDMVKIYLVQLQCFSVGHKKHRARITKLMKHLIHCG